MTRVSFSDLPSFIHLLESAQTEVTPVSKQQRPPDFVCEYQPEHEAAIDGRCHAAPTARPNEVARLSRPFLVVRLTTIRFQNFDGDWLRKLASQKFCFDLALK